MNVRNYGLGSRDLGRALVNAYQLSANGDKTNADTKSFCRSFANYLRDEHGIKDLRRVELEHVQGYAEHLNERYEQGEITAGSAQVMLSRVNVAMSNARLDDKCHLNPVRDAGLPTRSGIADSDRSTPEGLHTKTCQKVSSRLASQLGLQRELGLRFKESSLINAKLAVVEGEKTGKITIDAGTKGGRPREVPINSNAQLEALRTAASQQGSERSMIPEYQTWRQYQFQSYREMKDTGMTFHGERHSYANDRYEQLSGVQSPVRSGVGHTQHHHFISQKLGISLNASRQLDHQCRLQVSNELGHGRISITNAYLG
ncbi:integrase domain-containing protein [Photobacterium sp. ZSDE20]|uniref:Integrase domain-containing protein n=1 Tax=Photobacterium pectinilyticum TaxID=2906793 RepID=A0ABT1NB79_9GAMM|nr:integrase domain-containing protein [Photobacterium sp. ZSDE20]MCQ1061377.1 integrase domain-containing protein [Photobacterium sp. ZSDE20]MDD1830099.1 integrase domain-containing protein [Photobacterium sp. ZSDE20]